MGLLQRHAPDERNESNMICVVIRLEALIFASVARHDEGVLDMIVLMGRALALACRGHQEVVLENIALRQQLRALQRTVRRPRLRRRDRVFWVLLSNTWRDWRRALV